MDRSAFALGLAVIIGALSTPLIMATVWLIWERVAAC